MPTAEVFAYNNRTIYVLLTFIYHSVHFVTLTFHYSP
nr:MAG TPA: hypothetical protein [Caudoviricetes sp.]